MPVQASVPASLDEAITKAKQQETERVMATSEKDNINDITKQLAQLYINSVMT